ncbi:cell cycle control protein 50A [Centruroides vittatus]|uniref:cell cycle control protein 50A n=1 Tax=Centruroides vittatus TaxID=120091 RepID=UPI003510A569
MATPSSEELQVKSKRPSSSAFKQQKLPAWQPILTAGTVLPTFFIIGLAFIPIGIGLLVSSNEVEEHEVWYTNCTNERNESCADVIAKDIKSQCRCNLTFQLPNFKKEVYMYYGLTNYYQNHRRYVKSRDDAQLVGQSLEGSRECIPFQKFKNSSVEYYVAPCGAIANSLFNDSLKLYYIDDNNQEIAIGLKKTGIAWPTDKNVKFKNPPGNVTDGKAFKNTIPPPNWRKPVWQLDLKDENNNGYQNEDLIVWMRTAALPTFRKLYRRINHNQERFKNGLPNGTYKLVVDYNYPVTSFKGTKRMILSNTSWLGGKNSFLGIAYIVVGSICLVLAVIFLVIHIKFGKNTHDLVNITQRTPY